ncbi:MAG: hypothetical protein K6D96_05270 [Acetatifactor sp.]|nr:hypothetical protein [Acetatifactor sp.]
MAGEQAVNEAVSEDADPDGMVIEALKNSQTLPPTQPIENGYSKSTVNGFNTGASLSASTRGYSHFRCVITVYFRINSKKTVTEKNEN